MMDTEMWAILVHHSPRSYDWEIRIAETFKEDAHVCHMACCKTWVEKELRTQTFPRCPRCKKQFLFVVPWEILEKGEIEIYENLRTVWEKTPERLRAWANTIPSRWKMVSPGYSEKVANDIFYEIAYLPPRLEEELDALRSNSPITQG